MACLTSQTGLDDRRLDRQKVRSIFTAGDEIAPRILGKFVGKILERHGNAHAARLLCPEPGQATTVQLVGMVSSG